MKTIFSYKILILSQSQTTLSHADKISESMEIEFTKTSTMMEALEYLMDFTADLILVDFSIDKEQSINFLQHISEDYENKSTPIVALANIEEYQNVADELESFNVISIMCDRTWTVQATKLFNFLKISKLNLYTIQDNLIESEDRGTLDQLTGAYNRYGCEDIFHKLTSREKAYQEPFSLIIVDIDHFKVVNDTYGHDVGDEVLINFANILMSSIRRDDSLVRLGGEEFIIFLSNANHMIAIKSAEKIRIKIEEAIHSSQNLQVTASFGVVQYENNEDIRTIIKRADELLYIAKDSGRNRVISQKP